MLRSMASIEPGWANPTGWQFASDLSARSSFLPGSTKPVKDVVRRLDADLYWVVGHYEGILVAAELLCVGKLVHLC